MICMNVLEKESVKLHSQGDELAGVLFLPGDSANPSPALIVCHGAGEFKENYFELCEFLADKGIASLAIDMHGHGSSGGARFHVNISQWVADIRAAVKFLTSHPGIDSDKLGAFGLSSGGTAILEAALVEPRLKALVALDATVRSSMPWPSAAFLKALIWLGRIKRALTKKDLRLSMMKFLESVRMAADPEVERRLRENPKCTAAFKEFPFPGGEQ